MVKEALAISLSKMEMFKDLKAGSFGQPGPTVRDPSSDPSVTRDANRSGKSVLVTGKGSSLDSSLPRGAYAGEYREAEGHSGRERQGLESIQVPCRAWLWDAGQWCRGRCSFGGSVVRGRNAHVA